MFERFRSAVAGEGFGPVDSLTVSVGVAQLGDLDLDGSALFRRADAALYAAKAGGRNQFRATGNRPQATGRRFLVT